MGNNGNGTNGSSHSYINDNHRKYLKEDSGISDSAMEAASLFSVTPEQAEQYIGLKKSGIIFPYFDSKGKAIEGRLRLDDPIVKSDGKKIRYYQPPGTSITCYFLSRAIRDLLNPKLPLFVTEGEKKLLSIVSNVDLGTNAIASIPGCWCFKERGEKKLSSIWSEFILAGREVSFIPDTDYFTNPKVTQAGDTFIRLMVNSGAIVNLIDLRDSTSGSEEKIGADDFIIKYGSDEFYKRCHAPVWTFSRVPDDLGQIANDETVVRNLLKQWVMSPEIEVDSALAAIKKRTKFRIELLRDLLRGIRGEWSRLRGINVGKGKQTPLKEISLDSHIPRRQVLEEIAEHLRLDGRFYSYGKELLFIEGQEKVLLGQELLPGRLSSIGVEFTRLNYQTQTTHYQLLPSSHASAIFHSDDLKTKFREITLFVDHPTYGEDWSLVKPGYNEREKIYYAGESILPSQSLDAINEITKDFLFLSRASLCNFIAVLLSSILRNKYRGDRPMAAMTGNRPGLGKSLACKVVGVVAEGKIPESASFHTSQEEFEKQIASRITDRDVLLIDNVKSPKPIDSVPLERLITDPVISFRKLGTSTTITRPNTVIPFISMNDAKFCRDLITRSLPIQFYMDEAHDVSKHKFAHDSLLDLVKKNRSQILSELCGMVERWKQAGQPHCNKSFRFREWTKEIGGVLEVNGFSEFLDNLETASAEYDEASNEIGLLFHNSLDRPLTAEQLVTICQADELFPDIRFAKRPSTVLANTLKKYLNKKLPLPGGGFFSLKDGPLDRHLKIKTYIAESVCDNSAGLAGSRGFVDIEETRTASSGNQKVNSGSAGTAGSQTGLVAPVEKNVFTPAKTSFADPPGNPVLEPAVPANTANPLVTKGETPAGSLAGSRNNEPARPIASPQQQDIPHSNGLEW